jgi:hypothetical protein
MSKGPINANRDDHAYLVAKKTLIRSHVKRNFYGSPADVMPPNPETLIGAYRIEALIREGYATRVSRDRIDLKDPVFRGQVVVAATVADRLDHVNDKVVEVVLTSPSEYSHQDVTSCLNYTWLQYRKALAGKRVLDDALFAVATALPDIYKEIC